MNDFDDLPLIAQDKYEPSAARASAPTTPRLYYEWIEPEGRWGKINDDDPDPPALPAGKFDGYVIEIDRDSMQPV